jgi:hypothetical protein
MKIADAKRQVRMDAWARNIEDRQARGQSIKAWCATNGCKESQYYYWLKVIREKALEHIVPEDHQGALVRIEPEELPSSLEVVAAHSNEHMVLQYGNATVTIPAGTPAATVAQLLRALHTHD